MMGGHPSEVEGGGVLLTPFEERFVNDDYIAWLNDRDLMRYSDQRSRTHDRTTSLEYLRSFRDRPHHFWAVLTRIDGLLVGTMTAYVDTDHLVADMGILIGRGDVRGTGVGRAAWGLALRHLFEADGLRKVTAGTSALNQPMIRICQHWGMQLEGTRREQQLIASRPTDVLLFGILSREWERGRSQGSVNVARG